MGGQCVCQSSTARQAWPPSLTRCLPRCLTRPTEQAACHQLPEYEPAHAKTMAALPAGSGAVCESSMLLYLAPDANCNVGYTLELFAPQVRLPWFIS